MVYTTFPVTILHGSLDLPTLAAGEKFAFLKDHDSPEIKL
jgi:hypothetical protein